MATVWTPESGATTTFTVEVPTLLSEGDPGRICFPPELICIPPEEIANLIFTAETGPATSYTAETGPATTFTAETGPSTTWTAA